MLNEPARDKMIMGAPSKKEYHFAATAEHFAEVVRAETLAEAEATYHRVKRLISPLEEQSTVEAPAAAQQEGVQ